MRTVLLGKRPPEVDELIARRHALGQDLFDEVWEDDYHMAPAPHGRHAEVDDEVALILGPRAKRAGLRGRGPANLGTPDFYFRAGVKEVGIIDPNARTVEWYARGETGFRPAEGSHLLDISTAELAKEIDWPQ